MPNKHLFKLSAISVALLGLSSVGYAVECQAPITIKNTQNVVLENCHLNEFVEAGKRYRGQDPLLVSENSELNIINSHLNLKSESYYNRVAVDSKTSKLTIKNSEISSHYATQYNQGRVLSAEGSDILIDNSKLNGDIILAIFQHHPSTININNSIIEAKTFTSSTGNVWVNAPFAEKTVVNVNQSKISSDMFAGPFSTNMAEGIDFNVSNSEISGKMSMWTENTLPLNMVLNNSIWTIPNSGRVGSDNINNLTLQSSEIIFERDKQDNPSFIKYNIFGNLSGNGHFELNTDLASNQSDIIVVKGKDSGTFTLGIQDSGNEPKTINGKVTLVETQTGQAQFSLKDKDYVDAGAYRYRLSQDGTNWILSNRAGETNTQPDPVLEPEPPVEQPAVETPVAETVEQPVVETPAAETVEQPAVETLVPIVVAPVIPAVVETITNDKPSEQPAMAVLSEKSNALVSLRQAQGLLISQNLQGIHQRLGELKTDKNSNVWVKNVNGRHTAKAQNVAVDSRSSGFEMDYHQLQIGADRAVSENVRLGGFVGTSGADVDFNGEYGKGKLRSQAVGLYGTFAHGNGWYWDNVAKYERLTAQSASTDKRKYHAFSFSSEIGKQIAFGHQWTLTPQTQLGYHSISSKSDEERLNLLSLRTGLRVAKSIELGDWKVQPYAEVNGIFEHANNAKVRVNQYQFDVPENKNRMQTSFGLTAGNSSHRLGIELSQTHGKQVRQPLNVLVNYRYQW